MRAFFWGLGVMVAGSMMASADSIVIEDKMYTDVLVYQSGDFYYVKIPREGKSLSVAKAKVTSDQVEIDEDPYYREQLRNLYKVVKEGGEAALKAARPVDSAFTDVAGSRTIDTSALFSAGGGKPMNMLIADAKAGAAKAGVNVTKSGDGFKGTSDDGVMSITISAENGKVTGLAGEINSPDPQVIQGKMFPLIGLIAKVAPWVQQWVLGNIAQLSVPGASIQKTQDGVSVVIGVSESGLNFSVKGA